MNEIKIAERWAKKLIEVGMTDPSGSIQYGKHQVQAKFNGKWFLGFGKTAAEAIDACLRSAGK